MAGTNRAQKVGVAYEVEKKMEQNYDREEEAGTPRYVVDWINGQLEGEPGYEPLKEYDWKSICLHLKSGAVLCQLINKLLKADGRTPVKFQKKAASPFVAMTNIENFCKGAQDYGLTKESTFQSGDLVEVRKGQFLNVLNCVHSLGFIANSKGVMPAYTGEISKTIDRE